MNFINITMKIPLNLKNEISIHSSGIHFPSPSEAELLAERLLTYGANIIDLRTGGAIHDNVPMAAAFQAINVIANALVQMPISVVDRNGKPRPQHAFNKLFAEPNQLMNRSQTFKRMYEDFIANGNGFGVLSVSGMRADTVSQIIPAKLRGAEWNRDGATPKAVYKLKRVGDEDAQEYTRQDIIHFADNYYNHSDLLAVSPLEIVQQIQDNMRKSSKLFMKSMQRITSSIDFFEVDRDVVSGANAALANVLYDKIEEAIGKARENGYVALPAGVKLASGNPKDAIDQTLLAYLTYAIEEVARAFNIGPRYLGVTRNVRVANELVSQGEDLLKITLSPRVRVIEEELTRILPESDKRNGLRVKLDTTEFGKGTIDDRLSVAKEGYMSGLLTRGEAREYLNDYETEKELDTFIHAVPGAAAGPEQGPNTEQDEEESEENS